MRTFVKMACASALMAACAHDKPADNANNYETRTAARTDTTVTTEGPRGTATTPAYSDGSHLGTTATDATVPAGTTGPGTTDTTRSSDTYVAPAPIDSDVNAKKADNTGVNQRDRGGATMTPGDQGNGKTDINITADIRKAVVGDGALSFSAKNVKIITKDGNVTLRGPVKTAAERTSIEEKATRVAGAGHVTNELEIAK